MVKPISSLFKCRQNVTRSQDALLKKVNKWEVKEKISSYSEHIYMHVWKCLFLCKKLIYGQEMTYKAKKQVSGSVKKEK
jgi:hypothetical protein